MGNRMTSHGELPSAESKVNDPTVIENTVNIAMRAKKKSRKINDGTDGIVATDEMTDADRWREAGDYFQND